MPLHGRPGLPCTNVCFAWDDFAQTAATVAATVRRSPNRCSGTEAPLLAISALYCCGLRRRTIAQTFLERFVRQNVAEIDEIPFECHRVDVSLPAAERAVYLELEHHLQALSVAAVAAAVTTV